MIIKRFLLCLGLAFTPQISVAQFEISAMQANKIINVAGRQRMLSQRIVKSACLTVARVDFSANFNATTAAHNEFQEALTGLRRGSVDLGILPVTLEAAVGEMKNVHTRWEELTPYIRKIMNSGTISAAELSALDQHSLELLEVTSNTVSTIVESYSASVEDISLGRTITVDIAGRQRMLSQKMVKEMCMMLVLGQPSADLSGTVNLFDASLNALITGYAPAGVMAPPTLEIRAKLINVQTLWDSLKSEAAMAGDGGIPSMDELADFANGMEAMLNAMNEIVVLYAE